MPRTLDASARTTLGMNIRERRERVFPSQAAAADAMEIPRARLNKWEKGRETPGTEGLLLLAISFKCSVDQLLSGVDGEYDAFIEARPEFDALAHLRAKTEAFIRRQTQAMQLALDVPAHVPTRATNAGGREAGRDTRSTARARQRKRPK